MIGRRSFLALPLAGIVPASASAEAKVGFVISDLFNVLGVSMNLEGAKENAIRLEMERYKKWYDAAWQTWKANKWWRDNHPRLIQAEVRPAKDKPDRWEVWKYRQATDEFYRSQVKIDAVQMV